jgi:hypothetical protein
MKGDKNMNDFRQIVKSVKSKAINACDLFPTTTPFNEAVDFTQLYKDLKEYFVRHVDLSDPRYYAVLASWAFATYRLDEVSCTPHLAILGQKSSGKTRMLETLRQVVCRGWMPISMTQASLYYFVDVHKPTLLIDESQVYGSEEYGAIRTLFGVYRPGQFVPRIRYSAELSKEERLEHYDVFSFKAFAGLKDISDNVSDRCISIMMLPATHQVLRKVDEVKGAELRSKLAKWPEQPLTPISNEMWTNIDPRLSELFETLLLNTPSVEDFNTIQSIMKELSLQKTATQKESLEADILRAFYKQAIKAPDHWTSTMSIYEEVNSASDYREAVTARQVAAVLHNFGFKARRKEHARGFTLDVNRITALSSRYGIDVK